MSKARYPASALCTPLVAIAILHMGACIEAAPFAGSDASDAAEPSDVAPDTTPTDSGIPDQSQDDSAVQTGDTEPDGEAPDGSSEDTTGPCDEAGCPCSEDADCEGGMTCNEGACCQPLCPDTAVCGSDGCGGDCGQCLEGEHCTPEHTCTLKCTPGESVCGVGEDADLVWLCNQDGTGYDTSVGATNCKSFNQSCLDGECQCASTCDPDSCTDDGDEDGCGGLCPETCTEKNTFCASDGLCTPKECPPGEVFCHTDQQPYLCDNGSLEKALAGGAVVDCEEAGCLLQNYGVLQSLISLDEFDLYCACSETQHCLNDTYLHYCDIDSGQAALLACAGNKVCNAEENACTSADNEPATNQCCAEHLGECGLVDACDGTCSCQNSQVYPSGYTCSDQGTCTAPCGSQEIGDRECIDDSLLKQCTANGWVLITCDGNDECLEDDTPGSAKCDQPLEQPPDLLALPLNTGEVMSPGVPVQGDQGTVPDHDDFSLNGGAGDEPFSLSMWIWGSDLNQENIQPLLRKGGIAVETAPGPAGAEWILFMKDKRLYWIVYDTNQVAWYKRSVLIGDQMSGSWAHVLLTYKGDNEGSTNPHEETRFYLDGEDVTDTSGAGSGSSSASAQAYFASPKGAKELDVGFTSSPEPAWFNGAIDDVTISRGYVLPFMLPSMTVGDTQCGVDLSVMPVFGMNLVAFWRFEDLGSGADESESLIDGHVMSFTHTPEPWDSPCSLVP